MSDTYIFSVASFPSVVNESRLDYEIRASPITVALSGVRREDASILIDFKAPLSSEEQAALAALVESHTGAPLPDGQRDLRGNPVVSPTFLHTDERARLRGYAFDCDPDETAVFDVEVTTQLLVQGGQFWVMAAQKGDIASFSVVDKNDVLGLHTAHAIPLGTPIELTKYVDSYPLPSTALYEQDITMPTVAPITLGLFLRCTYEAVAAGSARDIGIVFKWYEGA